MSKTWLVSDEVRSEMAIAAVDAGIHAGLAHGVVNKLSTQTPSAELTKVSGYLSHIGSLLNTLDNALRNKMTPTKGKGAKDAP